MKKALQSVVAIIFCMSIIASTMLVTLAAPGKISSAKATSITYNSATLSWSKSKNADGYEIQQYKSKKWTTIKKITSASTTTYKLTKLTTGTTYKYRIRAYDKGLFKTTYSDYKTVSVKPVPVKVSGLKAAGTSYNTVKLTWSKVSGATGYEVQQYKSKKWVTIKTLTARELSVSKLSLGTTYSFRVRAYRTVSKKKHYGAYSSTVKGTPQLAATSKISASGIATTGAKVSWSKVSGAGGYQVYDPVTKKWVSTGTKTYYTFKNQKAGTSYSVKVRAFKKVGSKTYYGKESSTVKYKTTPAKVSGVKASGAKTTSLTVSWSKTTGAAGYQVYIYDYSGAKKWVRYSNTTGTSLAIKDLKAGSKYDFRVRAYVKNGSSYSYGSYSSTITAYTATAAPTGLTNGKVTATSIPLSWKAVSGAKGYEVYNPATKKWVDVKTATSYTVSSLKVGTKYTFKVRAYIGSSKVYSAESSISISTAPSAATAVKASSQTTSSVAFSWTKSAGASGYRIYINGDYKKVVTSTSYTASSLKAATKYTIEIRPYVKNPAGNSYGEYTKFSTYTAPKAPTGVTVDSVTKKSAAIHWTAVSGASGYEVYDPINKDWFNNGTSTSYSYTSLTPGSTYDIRVRAYIGSSKICSAEASASKFVTIPLEPNLDVTPSVAGDNFVVSWPAVNGALSYQIEKSDDGSTWSAYASTATTSFKVKDVKPSDTYRFRVRAYINSTTYSDWVSIQHSPMTVSAGSGATATSTHITWNPVNGATRYVIEHYIPTSYSWALVGETDSTEYKPGVKANTAELYRVTACMDSVKFARGIVEAAPTGITLNKTAHGAKVSWNAVANTESYLVKKIFNVYSYKEYMYGTLDNDTTTSISKSATSFDFNLAPNQIHTYAIYANPSNTLVAQFTVSMGDLVIENNDASKTSQLLMLVEAINRTKYRDMNVTVTQDSTIKLSCDKIMVGGLGSFVGILDPEITNLGDFNLLEGTFTVTGTENVKKFMNSIDDSGAEGIDSTETIKETVTFTNGIGYPTGSNKAVYLKNYLEPSGSGSNPLSYLYNEHNDAAWKNGFSSVATTKNANGTYTVTATLKKEEYGTSKNKANATYHPGFISTFDDLSSLTGSGMDNTYTSIGATTIKAEIGEDGKLISYSFVSPTKMDLGFSESGMSMAMSMSGTCNVSYKFTR